MITVTNAWALTARNHDELADEVRREGHCVIPRLFPKSMISEWHSHFQPLLQSRITSEGTRPQSRGLGRYYITLPFIRPFADPFVFADPDILAVVDRLVGPDTVMCQLASDTPVAGSEHQEFHRDAPPLFPEWGRETPPFQLALNFPLVDVDEENGPLETTRGTHLMPKDEALAKVRSGEIPVEQVLMQTGDVMIRDVRTIHRGTPNRTREPRPMVVIGYSRRWLLRPEVSIRIPRATWDNLAENHRHLLRFNPRVEQLDPEAGEVYQHFAY